MKNIINFCFLLLLFLFVSCSSPTDPLENALSFESINSKLVVTNHSSETLYLFVVQRGTAASINWSPQFSDPKVLKYDSIIINFSDIYYGDKTVKSGDEVIVYYWDDSNKSKPNFHNKVIVL